MLESVTEIRHLKNLIQTLIAISTESADRDIESRLCDTATKSLRESLIALLEVSLIPLLRKSNL